MWMNLSRLGRSSALFAVTIVVAVLGYARTAESGGQERFAGVAVRAIDGDEMTLVAPNSGALVIVFLWTSCPNSNQYSPTLIRIAQDFMGKPVRMVGLFVDEDRTNAEVASHADDFALEFPIGREGAVRLAKELGVETVPSCVVIDDSGSVRYLGRINDQFYDLGRRRQVVRSDDLREAISAVLEGEPVRNPRTEAIGCSLPDFGGQP